MRGMLSLIILIGSAMRSEKVSGTHPWVALDRLTGTRAWDVSADCFGRKSKAKPKVTGTQAWAAFAILNARENNKNYQR